MKRASTTPARRFDQRREDTIEDLQQYVQKHPDGKSVEAASTSLMMEAAVLDLCGLTREAAEKLHEGLMERALSSPALRGTGLPYEKRFFTVKHYKEEMSKRAPDHRLIFPAHKIRGYRWRCPPPERTFDSFEEGAEGQKTSMRMLMETEVGHLSMPRAVAASEKHGEATLKLVLFAGQRIPPYTGALLRVALRCDGEVRGEWCSTSKPGGWPVWQEVSVMKVDLKPTETRVLELKMISDNGLGKVIATGSLDIIYKSGSVEFCSVRLRQESEDTADAYRGTTWRPCLILAYVLETQDSDLHAALLSEPETPSDSPSETDSALLPEVAAELTDTHIPEGLVLGCLRVSIAGVITKNPIMQMCQVEVIATVAPNEVVEKRTWEHSLYNIGQRWEEHFSLVLNWPAKSIKDRTANQFLQIRLKTAEGCAVAAPELSKQLIDHFDWGGAKNKLEGSCNVPLSIPEGLVEVIINWNWRPLELLCVDLIKDTIITAAPT